MKKVLAIILVLAMTFALVACGKKAETPAPAASTPAASTPASSGTSSTPAPAPAAEKPQVTIKWSCAESEDSVFGQTIKAALEDVTAKTDGNVKFE